MSGWASDPATNRRRCGIPYIDGKRVSNEEYLARNADTTLLHTSERGVNPGVVGAHAASSDESNDDSKDDGDKIVVGMHVEDAPSDSDGDVEAVGTASSALSGGIPGEPSESSETPEDSSDAEAPATAAEATENFVEGKTGRAKSRSGKAAKA